MITADPQRGELFEHGGADQRIKRMVFDPSVPDPLFQRAGLRAGILSSAVIDFGKMLTRGCKGMREEARARLAALEHPRDLAYRKPFYEAAIIACDALSIFARRYSELASDMAAKTKDRSGLQAGKVYRCRNRPGPRERSPFQGGEVYQPCELER